MDNNLKKKNLKKNEDDLKGKNEDDLKKKNGRQPQKKNLKKMAVT